MAPILFFNEADAILNKRRKIESSSDQMLNSMQNILLQYLEDFEGIFMATTNYINNLDDAFDRRIFIKKHLSCLMKIHDFKYFKIYFLNGQVIGLKTSLLISN